MAYKNNWNNNVNYCIFLTTVPKGAERFLRKAAEVATLRIWLVYMVNDNKLRSIFSSCNSTNNIEYRRQSEYTNEVPVYKAQLTNVRVEIFLSYVKTLWNAECASLKINGKFCFIKT